MDSISAPHLLQFYGKNERALTASVSRYLAEGLKQGEGILVVATLEHVDRFMQRLVLYPTYMSAVETGRLVCLDAEATLAQFMVDGQPQWNRFEQVIGSTIQSIQRRTGHAALRAYGEMVDLLWKAGQPAAAIRLEEYWNRLLASSLDCQLFCAYSIDIFSSNFERSVLAPILCTHTRILSSGEAVDLAVDLAVEEVLGTSVETIGRDSDRSGWAAMPNTTAAMLWLKDNDPATATKVLERARYYYEL